MPTKLEKKPLKKQINVLVHRIQKGQPNELQLVRAVDDFVQFANNIDNLVPRSARLKVAKAIRQKGYKSFHNAYAQPFMLKNKSTGDLNDELGKRTPTFKISHIAKSAMANVIDGYESDPSEFMGGSVSGNMMGSMRDICERHAKLR